MIRILILLGGFIMTLPVVAYEIPCIKWNPFGLEEATEILGEARASMVHDMSGRVSELLSDECWVDYDIRPEYSKIGMVEAVTTPIRLESGMCKAEFFEMTLENGEWISAYPRRTYAITLDAGDSCETTGVDDFIVLTNPVEDSLALLLLQNSQEIYNQYIVSEKPAIQDLELRYIGLHTTRELNTYFRLTFSGRSCNSEVLLVRIKESGKPEYVSYFQVMC